MTVIAPYPAFYGLLFPLFLPQDTINALSDFLGFFYFLFQCKIPLIKRFPLGGQLGVFFFPCLFYSYIVFSDRCTLKDITLTSGRHHVINRYNILPAVQQNIAKTGTRLSPGKIDALFEKLYPLTQIDGAEKAAHIRNIQQGTKNGYSQTVSNARTTPDIREKICPRCGGKLVMRTANKGERQGKKFFGCSHYPKCRYIENLPDE